MKLDLNLRAQTSTRAATTVAEILAKIKKGNEEDRAAAMAQQN